MRVIHRCTGERDLCETLLEHECLESIVRIPDTMRESLIKETSLVGSHEKGGSFTCQCSKCGDVFTLSRCRYEELHHIAYGKCANGDAYARSVVARMVTKTLEGSYISTWSTEIYVTNRPSDSTVSQKETARIQEQLRQIPTDPNLTFGGDHNHVDVPLFEMVSCPSIKMSDLRRHNTAETQRILAKAHHDAQVEEDKLIFAAINTALSDKLWTKITIGGRDLFYDDTIKFVSVSFIPSEVMVQTDDFTRHSLHIGMLVSSNHNGKIIPTSTPGAEWDPPNIGVITSLSPDKSNAHVRLAHF